MKKRVIIKTEEGHTIWMDYDTWVALKKFGDSRPKIGELILEKDETKSK